MSFLFTNKRHLFFRLVLIVWTCCACACSTISAQRRLRASAIELKQSHRQKRTPLDANARARILAHAQEALGRSRVVVGRRAFRSDCSGTVRGIFAGARIGLGGIIKHRDENDVKAIYRYVQTYGKIHREKPEPGDLVFFHNTYDRSRDGRMRDALTHVGIVEKIEGTTVSFIHHLGQSIIRSRMNLSYPKATFDPRGQTRINHILRKPQGKHRAYTAAELFAGYGRL